MREVEVVSEQPHEQVLSTEIEEIAFAELVYRCVEFRRYSLLVTSPFFLWVRGCRVTVVLKRSTVVTLAEVVVSVCTMREGNGVVLAELETEQLHLHLGAKVEVEDKYLVAVVAIEADGSTVDDIAVVRYVFTVVVGAEVAETLSDELVVSPCAALVL